MRNFLFITENCPTETNNCLQQSQPPLNWHWHRLWMVQFIPCSPRRECVWSVRHFGVRFSFGFSSPPNPPLPRQANFRPPQFHHPVKLHWNSNKSENSAEHKWSVGFWRTLTTSRLGWRYMCSLSFPFTSDGCLRGLTLQNSVSTDFKWCSEQLTWNCCRTGNFTRWQNRVIVVSYSQNLVKVNQLGCSLSLFLEILSISPAKYLEQNTILLTGLVWRCVGMVN